MSKLRDYKLLSFDVYGTLVDYETGILQALEPLIASSGTRPSKTEILQAFHAAESAQQKATPEMTYTHLLTTVHPQVARALGLNTPSDAESLAFGKSVGTWPAFADTVDALRRLGLHFKLVVLSNVDRESFARTNAEGGALAGVRFDAVYTAQDIGSYKPALRNFEYLLRRAREDFGVEKGGILQTAQSQWHDHRPAREMGIKSVWIERPGGVLGNVEDAVYDWKFATLGDMADALEGQDA